MFTLFRIVLGVVTLGLTGAPGVAQDYPSRNITMIVPFAAGGPTDVIGRLVASHMSTTLGQQIVIENVLGAGGTTGSVRAMRATPPRNAGRARMSSCTKRGTL